MVRIYIAVMFIQCARLPTVTLQILATKPTMYKKFIIVTQFRYLSGEAKKYKGSGSS